MKLEIGKCYQDGLGQPKGPMRPYGPLFLQDANGFAFMRETGLFFDIPPRARPDRDLMEECECPKKTGGAGKGAA